MSGKKFGFRQFEKKSKWFTGILDHIQIAISRHEKNMNILKENVKTKRSAVVIVKPKCLPLVTYSLLFFAVFAFLIGLYLASCYGSSWFSKCASLTVLFGVAAEYRLFRYEMLCLYGEIEIRSAVWSDAGYGDLSREAWHSWASLIAHMVVIVGTLVWGFGELVPFAVNEKCT